MTTDTGTALAVAIENWIKAEAEAGRTPVESMPQFTAALATGIVIFAKRAAAPGRASAVLADVVGEIETRANGLMQPVH